MATTGWVNTTQWESTATAIVAQTLAFSSLIYQAKSNKTTFTIAKRTARKYIAIGY